MNRRGVSLVETIIALVLAGIVLGAFVRTMSVQRRSETRVARAYGAASAAEAVVRVSTAMLSRIARDDSVWIRGDTAIEWRATVGVALACVAGGDSIVLPDAGAAAWWEIAPDSGDAADVEVSGAWTRYEVLRVQQRASGGVCGARQTTLHIGGSLSDGVAPVRVTRRTRLALYRGGDGAWWMGERRCPDQGAPKCAAAQPVAGPLDRPPTGLAFAVDRTTALLISVVASSSGVVRTGAVAVSR